MNGYQINKISDEFSISLASAITMRIRYLVNVIGEWENYIEGITDVVPSFTIGIAFDKIHELKLYEQRAKKGPIKGQITDDMVQAARDYPINQLIEFDRAGFAPCFVHMEKTGSLKYYPNTNKCHCFGCGWNGDSISVLTERDGFTFISAVKHLSGVV